VTGLLAAAVGGFNNTTSGTDSFVGGGSNNVASGPRSFVGGGANDEAGLSTCAWLANVNVVAC
jgi:hypothetical protein